jgi:uncharacterized membrane protein YsdA (DUF1294 family)
MITDINIPLTIFFSYLVIINLITFFYFGWDKMRSEIPEARRIPEKILWLLSLLGGSVGALLGMNFFRHKTKKLSFQAIIAIIICLQIWLIYWLLK